MMVDPAELPKRSHAFVKNGDGLAVRHEYHEHAWDPFPLQSRLSSKRNNGNPVAFPLKLHEFLDVAERDGFADVVSWQPHGRCFCIHKPCRFKEILPRYFSVTKVASFQRQLNLYDFRRLTRKSPDKGGYYNELFLRTRPDLSLCMKRIKLKGMGVRLKNCPDEEPDFYTMPSLPAEGVSAPFPMAPTVVSDSSLTSSIDPCNALLRMVPALPFDAPENVSFGQKTWSNPSSKVTRFPSLLQNTVEVEANKAHSSASSHHRDQNKGPVSHLGEEDDPFEVAALGSLEDDFLDFMLS